MIFWDSAGTTVPAGFPLKDYMKRIYFIFFFIIAIVITAIFPTPAAAQVGTVIRLDPQMIAVDHGESFALDIWVDDVQYLAAFDVVLHFNPNYLTVNNLEIGDFLSPGFGGNDFDNETGIIHFYNAILSTSEPGSGSGILFTVYFTAKAVDADTLISIDEALTELVEAETNDLIPYTAQSGYVQIIEGGAEHKIFLPLVLG